MPAILAIGAIGRNAFREAIRDRILFSLLIFAILMAGAGILFTEMSFSIQAQALINFSLGAITLIGVLIAVLLGNQLVSKEIERRTLYTLLAHPVGRTQFVLGKFCGLAATLAVNCGLMGVAFWLALTWMLPHHFAPGEAILVAAMYFIFLALALVTALSLLFSCISSPALAGIFSLGLFIIGNFDVDLRSAGRLSHHWLEGHLVVLISYLLPNFGNFNIVTAAAHLSPVRWNLIGLNTAYAAVYCAVLLALAGAILERKDLK